MSAVATVSTVQGATDQTNSRLRVELTITLSGNYGGASTHGDPLNLSGLGIPSNALPSQVVFQEASPAGAAPSSKTFKYMPGTTQANGLLYVENADGTEYTQASAYGTPPFAIVAFALKAIAFFPKFQ